MSRLNAPKNPFALLAILVAALILGLLIAAPMAMVVAQAFSAGLGGWWAAVTDEETLRALRLSALVAVIAVPVNTLGGVAAAWWIARFRFRGRKLVTALLDLPLSVSPVVAGLLFVLLFGTQGWWGNWLQEHDIRILFAIPGIALATLFVTLPMVAREVLPLLQAQGSDVEWAAVTMGANGTQLFWKIVFPRMRWAVLYGVLLTGARALGEFGAVSVVSGHIRGETNTLPLHIEVLYAEYHSQQAFAASSLLVLAGLLALVVRRALAARLPQGAPRGH